jgi:hypothetical protein
VYSLSRAAGQDVGEYAISVTAEATSNPNYTITTTGGTFKIAAKAVTITVANASKTYGDADPTFTGTVEGLVTEGDLGVVTYSRTNDAENVGTYEKVLTASYTANANYDVTVVPGNFVINPATMTLAVTDYSAAYDGAAHTVTATPSVTEGTTLSYSEDGETWSTSVTYTDFTNGAKTVYVKAENSNYETVTETGTVTIAKAKIELTGTGTKTYNGTEQKLELSASDATGVVSGETLGFQNTPTVKGTNAGSYNEVNYGTWYVTKANDDDSTQNYEIEVTGTLTIEPAAITIKADNASKTYGEADPAELTATVTGVPENGVAPVYSVSRATGENAGTYTISVKIGRASCRERV